MGSIASCEGQSSSRHLWLGACILFVSFGSMYWVTRSKSLDDWDSVQFAAGVNEFNLRKHQPHPPGYPLYVWTGQLVDRALGLGPQASLQVLASLGGGLFVAAWYAQLAKRYGAAVGLGTALVTGLCPGIWITSLQVLTDIPAAAALAVLLLGLLHYRQTRRIRWLVLSGLAGAITVGVRPQLFVFVLIVQAAHLAWQPDRPRRWCILLGSFSLGCLGWLIPLMSIQWGVDPTQAGWLSYFDLCLDQWRYRIGRPVISIIGVDFSVPYLLDRLRSHFLAAGVRNLGFFRYHSGWPSWMAGILWAGGVVLYLARRGRRRGTVRFWKDHLPWAAVLIVMVFVTLPAARRYYGALVPLVIFPAVLGWFRLPRGGWLAVPAMAAALAMVSLPLALHAHRIHAPPVRAALFVKGRHRPGRHPPAVAVTYGILRHVQWYAPEFHAEHLTPEHLRRIERGELVVYTDQPHEFRMQHPGRCFRFEPVLIVSRSILIHDKHARIVLSRVLLAPEVLEEPAPASGPSPQAMPSSASFASVGMPCSLQPRCW